MASQERGRNNAPVTYRIRSAVDDIVLSDLHADAFATTNTAPVPWTVRLNRFSLVWITAHIDDELIGFVNVVGDGGAHAFLIDTIVSPAWQGNGIGSKLVAHACREARDRGCEWLHVDYEPKLAGFYENSCGFAPTQAGLLNLRH